MKHPWAILPLAAVLLLCSCTRTPQSGSRPAGSPAPATAEAAAPPETEPPTQTPETADPAAGLADAGLPVLAYDEIRAVRLDSSPYRELADGYYTMCQDGLWGLMRANGTEVLACQFSAPVTGCALPGHWHASAASPMSWEALDALTAQLQASGDGEMCSGAHDGSIHHWYYDTQTHKVQVDAGLFGGGVHDPETSDARYGTYLPCRLGTRVDGQGDPDYYVPAEPAALVYANTAGELLNDETYEAAGCFYDQPLAPARQGGKWLYLDRAGRAVTEAVYDATYGDAEAAYASPLLNGYAAVCRGGRWGLLDGSGAERIPCVYAGAAWDGGVLWLQQDDGWHAYTLPGVVKPTPAPAAAPLTGIPDTIVAPDSVFGDESEQTRYRTTTAGNLMLRAGPGTAYEKIGSLPPGTAVACLGRSEAAENWILVCYEGQFGWACTDHMS